MTAEFHDKERSNFINTCTDKNLTADNLRTRFTEDMTIENVTLCTNLTSRKIRDFLDSKYIACGKGSGKSIQHRLSLLLAADCAQSSWPVIKINSFSTISAGSAKRDILKVPRNKDDVYGGP